MASSPVVVAAHDSSSITPDSLSPTATFESGSRDLESCTSSPTKRRFFLKWFWASSSESRTAVVVREDDKGSKEYEDPYAVITRSLDACPDGYHRVATFQSSDSNFAVFRSFRYSHCRILCALQYEIGLLERQLDDLDEWDQTSGDKRKLACQERDELSSSREMEGGTFPSQFKKTRSEVLAELSAKLIRYDEVLLKSREIMSLPSPSKRDYRSVCHFFQNLQPIVQEEAGFIRHKEDLITLRSGREYAGFDTLIEGILIRLDMWLEKAPFNSNIVQRIFLTPELRAKTSKDTIRYYAPERVERLVNIIIAIIILIVMVIPVFGMYWLSKSTGRPKSPFEAICILIISTLLFGAVMSSLTKAKRAELFAATAAYCAVLVVFITNFSVQTVQFAHTVAG